MRYLVTGVRGQLGYDVCNELRNRGNSLMNNDDYMSKLKKTDDIIKQSEFLFQNINKEKNISFYEFISSTLIEYL